LTFSNIMEMYLQALPLCILQYFNDTNLNKPWEFVRIANVLLSSLNLLDLFAEMLISQLIDRTGSKYHLMKSEYEIAESIEQKKKLKEKKQIKLNKNKGDLNEEGKMLLKAKNFGKSIDSISNCHTKMMAFLKLPEISTMIALVYAFLIFPLFLQSSYDAYNNITGIN